MPATLARFDFKDWTNRFGAALEDTAARARHMRVPFGIYGSVPVDGYRREMHRRYQKLAALAKTDSYARKLFDESRLWLDALPDGVQDLLLEHPVIARVWSSGSREGFHFVRVLGHGHGDVKFLIANLAKLSVKVGGRHAATKLHRLLVAGAGVRLHAREIIVLHGLELDAPVTVGQGAFLAPYDAVRKRFGLPEDPEPWLNWGSEGLDRHPGRLAHTSSRTVFVRRVRWGPAIAPCHCSTDADSPATLRYRFPEDYRVESIEDVFEARDTLVHLLGIAVRSKLVSHTVITAVPRWMSSLDPNYRTGSPGGQWGVLDVWPKDHAPTRQEIDEFVAAARGWVSFCAGRRDRRMELAVRRTAACFGIAGGRFGVAERLLDAGIALEAMYGPIDYDITRRIRQRAAWLLGQSAAERDAISKQMRAFYKSRSKVVHGTVSKNPEKREQELAAALESGQELARRTLFALLDRGPINKGEWDRFVPEEPAAASGRQLHRPSK